MSIEIGLTGGIGSGKSTAARIFETLGYAVYYADDRAKALYTENEVVRERVIQLFGSHIYKDDGQLDRGRLANIVFQDKALLQQLNGIIHPATAQDFEMWKQDLLAGGYQRRFLLKEAAILFEAGTYSTMDAVVDVYAPKSVRLARVMQRDASSKAQILARMANQWPDARKVLLADYVLYNDGRHALIPQVLAAADYLEARFFNP